LQDADSSKAFWRTTRVLVLAGVVLLVQAMMWAMHINMANQSISGVATPYLKTVGALEKSVVQDLLMAPQRGTDVLKSGVERGEVPGLLPVELNDAEAARLIQYQLEILRNEPRMVFLGLQIGNTKSLVYGAYRSVSSGNENVPFLVMKSTACVFNGVAHRGYHEYNVSNTLPLFHPSTWTGSGCPYSPPGHEAGSTARGWWNITYHLNKPGWGEGPYVDAGTFENVVSYSNIVRDTSGGIAGIICADLALGGISKYLQQNLQIGVSGQTFIAEKKNGNLIAASIGKIADTTGAQLTGWQSANKVISGAFAAVNAELGSLSQIVGFDEISANYFSGQPFVAIQPITSLPDSGHGLDWVAGAVIPAEDYLSFIFPGMLLSSLGCGLVVLGLSMDVSKTLWEGKEAHAMVGRLSYYVAISGMLWVMWLILTKSETEQMAFDSMSSGLLLTDMQAVAYLKPVERMLETSARLQTQSFVNFTSNGMPAASTLSHFCALAKLTNCTSYAGYANGDFAGCGILTGTGGFFAYIRNSATAERLSTYNVNAAGVLGTIIAAGDPYVASIRPWFKTGVSFGNLTQAQSSARQDDLRSRYGKDGWSAIYADSISGLLALTAVVPIYSPTGTVLGVLGSDVNLADLSQKVQQQANRVIGGDTSKGSSLGVVVESNGVVVASSTGQISESSTTGQTSASRLFVTRMSNSIIVDAFVYMQTFSTDFQFFSNQWRGQYSYLLLSSNSICSSLHNINWICTYLTPRGFLFDALDKNTQITFSMVCFGFTLLVYLVTISVGAKPPEEQAITGDDRPWSPPPMLCSRYETLMLTSKTLGPYVEGMSLDQRRTIAIEQLTLGSTSIDMFSLNGIIVTHGEDSWQYRALIALFGKSYKQIELFFNFLYMCLTVWEADMSRDAVIFIDGIFIVFYMLKSLLELHLVRIAYIHSCQKVKFSSMPLRQRYGLYRCFLGGALLFSWWFEAFLPNEKAIQWMPFLRPCVVFVNIDGCVKAINIFFRTCFHARTVFLLLGAIYAVTAVSMMLLLRGTFQAGDDMMIDSFLQGKSLFSHYLVII